MGCLRASIVLLGVSIEDTLTGFFDILSLYPNPPEGSSVNYNDFLETTNDTNNIRKRLDSGFKILKTIKDMIYKSYRKQKPDWWSIWEPIPETLNPYLQSIRISRNTAAHTIDDVFTPAQVGLLLTSLPYALESIGEIGQFLQSPPEGVTLPAL
jgi:hypothetical protein